MATKETEQKQEAKKSKKVKRPMLPGVRISKTINRGPFRLNITKSGVGVSVGVPNARVGVGPSGKYVSIFGRRTKLTRELISGMIKSFLS